VACKNGEIYQILVKKVRKSQQLVSAPVSIRISPYHSKPHIIQCDQSLNTLCTESTWLNVTAWHPTARAKGTLDSH
jgi:hypothetical protein